MAAAGSTAADGTRVETRVERRIQPRRKARHGHLELRAGLRAQPGSPVVSAGKRLAARRTAHHRGATRAPPQPHLPARQPPLGTPATPHRLHLGLPHHHGQATIPLRTPRSERTHTHRRRSMARHLDPRKRHALALVWRGRRHGVLPHRRRTPHPGQRRLGQRPALRRRVEQPENSVQPLHPAQSRLGTPLPPVAHGLGRDRHPHLPRRRTAQRDTPQPDPQRLHRAACQPL